jgi:hypothetical protein
VGTSEQAANIYVTSYPAVPWSAISDKLEPKHNISTVDARNLAAVTTQGQVSEFLSLFSAGLGIGLPQKTTSSASTLSGDGVVTTTGSTKADPGVIPSTSGATAVSISPKAGPPDLSKMSTVAGVDATTQLMAGTAVYQLAQILDNQISKSIPLQHYQAHLITVQVNLQPNGRNLPYDAYLTLTFMPPSLRKGIVSSADLAASADNLAPIIIYPLVISDALESSSVTRSIETIRQAALSLSGIVRNAGLNAGFNGGTDRFDAIFGADRNTLVTVGRVSDHTLRIRLGAQQQGTRLLAMVPRTQNISIVVFTREGKDEDTYLDKLAVVTETTLVDVETGKRLPNEEEVEASSKKGFLSSVFQPSPSVESRGDKVIELLQKYGFHINKEKCPDKDVGYDLLRSLDRGDYDYISTCLLVRKSSLLGRSFVNEIGPDGGAAGEWLSLHDIILPPSKNLTKFHDGLAPIEELKVRRVLAELMTLQVQSRYSKLMIKLSEFPKIEDPSGNQLVILKDDGRALSALVTGGANLDKTKLKPRLEFNWNGSRVVFFATALDTGPGGTDVSITFPSLVGSGLWPSIKSSISGKDDSKMPAALVLYLTPQDTEREFRKLLYLEENANSPKNPVSTSINSLDKHQDGTANLMLTIGEWKVEPGKELGLKIMGADVRSIEPPVVIDANKRAIPIKPSSVVKLTLENLTTDEPVQIRTISGSELVGPPILLPVKLIAAKK